MRASSTLVNIQLITRWDKAKFFKGLFMPLIGLFGLIFITSSKNDDFICQGIPNRCFNRIISCYWINTLKLPHKRGNEPRGKRGPNKWGKWNTVLLDKCLSLSTFDCFLCRKWHYSRYQKIFIFWVHQITLFFFTMRAATDHPHTCWGSAKRPIFPGITGISRY